MSDYSENLVELYPNLVKLERSLNMKDMQLARQALFELNQNVLAIGIKIGIPVDGYFKLIRQWAQDRNLIEGSTASKQLNKLVEKLGELAHGINKNRPAEIQDGIGDMVVVFTILAAQCGTSIEECMDNAWQEIKDRRERMVDGIFVKEADDVVQANAGV